MSHSGLQICRQFEVAIGILQSKLGPYKTPVGSHAWLHLQLALTWLFTNCLIVTARQFVSPSASFPTCRQRRRSFSSVGQCPTDDSATHRSGLARGDVHGGDAIQEATRSSIWLIADEAPSTTPISNTC